MISVLIPIYNAEKYLERCLESVVNQTYRDLEILLVNDGSTDQSLAICERYAKQDNRIRLIDKENEGAGITRHRLLHEASGEYFLYIDSDDYFTPNAVETLVRHMRDDVDMVMAQHTRYATDTTVTFKQVSFPVGEFETDTVPKRIDGILQNRHGGELWNHLGRTALAKQVWAFPMTMPFGEDVLMMAQYYLQTRKLVCLEDVTYFYEFRPDSLARSTNTHTILPLFAEKSAQLFEKYAQDPAIQQDFSVLLESFCNLAIIKYAHATGGRDKLIADLHVVAENPVLQACARSFIKRKRYFKTQYHLHTDAYQRILCFYKAIRHHDAWYYTRLYPARLEGTVRTAKVIINKVIGRVTT